MPEIEIPNNWRPRPYQRPLWDHMERGGLRAYEVAHRRWGKDDVMLHRAMVAAIERPATYWHALPEYAQARKAIWTAVNSHTGKRRIDEAFPVELRDSTNDQEMFIRFKNGSTWQVVGSDRYNSLVGSGVAGVSFSEWALCNPSAWAYIRPMLEENGGWAAFITTPRGRNHAHDMLRMAQESPHWFAEVSDVHKTGALTPEQLDESLREYVSIYGEDLGTAQFRQEYLCDFNAAILGAFYAREMVAVRSEGRISEIDPIPDRPVHRAWDIGVNDDTSIWWFQVVGAQVFVLDCYSTSGVGVDHYAEIIGERRAEHGWKDGIDFVPHDIKVKEWGTGRTRVETMRDYGLNPRLVENASKLDGINAARRTLSRAVFHPRCESLGIAALEQYRREWDDDKKTFRASEYRDWTTHLADAFRYLALAWRLAPRDAPEVRGPVQHAGLIKPPPVPTGNSGRIRL